MSCVQDLLELLSSTKHGFACPSGTSLSNQTALFMTACGKHKQCLLGQNTNDLEIALRNILADLLDTFENKSGEMLSSDHSIYKLIEFAGHLSINYSLDNKTDFGASSKPIMYILIEDLLEGLSLSKVENAWQTVVIPMTPLLTNTVIFDKGHSYLLRSCNRLLRKLSRSIHTELCGKVLIFLARIFPLTAKSAVNIPGKNNTSNNTVYAENETVYKRELLEDSKNDKEMHKSSESELQGQDDADKDIEENLYGDIDDSLLEEGEEEDVDDDDDDVVEKVDISNIPYKDYKKFWTLQDRLTSDIKRTLTNTDNTLLLANMMDVLRIMKKYAPANEDKQAEAIKEKRQRMAVEGHLPVIATGDIKGKEDEFKEDSYLGCKFLTSPKLFGLELQDGQFRQQVCIQVLMVCHHMRFVYEKQPSMKEENLQRLSKLEDIAFMLLENTPCGSRLKRAMLQVLHRESNWRQWKEDGCSNFELSLPEDNSVKLNDSSLEVPKNFWMPSDPLKESEYIWQYDEEKVVASAKNDDTPKFEKFLEPYLEADDPEAGIEEQYHPKNDPFYCWRATRLLTAKNPKALMCFHGVSSISEGLRNAIYYDQNADNNKDLDKKESNEVLQLQPVLEIKQSKELLARSKALLAQKKENDKKLQAKINALKGDGKSENDKVKVKARDNVTTANQSSSNEETQGGSDGANTDSNNNHGERGRDAKGNNNKGKGKKRERSNSRGGGGSGGVNDSSDTLSNNVVDDSNNKSSHDHSSEQPKEKEKDNNASKGPNQNINRRKRSADAITESGEVEDDEPDRGGDKGGERSNDTQGRGRGRGNRKRWQGRKN